MRRRTGDEEQGEHTEIVQVVLERVLNLLTDFQEAKEEERSESGTRDGDPLHGINNLERQEEKVQPTRKH
jgi:hypothetical protein